MLKTLSSLILATTIASGCSSGNSAADEFIESAIVEACQQLVTDYAYFRDRPDPDGYAGTFADDGVLVLPTGTFTGRETLRQRMLAGAGKTVSRHMMSTTRIEVSDARNATGVSYAIIFIADTVEGLETSVPASIDKIYAVGEYHDSFRLTDRGWKFARREFVPVFNWTGDET